MVYLGQGTLAWKIPWTEEPGRLQFMGSRRVRHDWATSLSLLTFMHGRGKWQLTPVFLPGQSQGRGSLVGYLYGVAQCWTWLSDLAAAAATVSSTEQFKKIIDELHFISLLWIMMLPCLKPLCLIQKNKDFLLCFLLKLLQFFVLYIGLWSILS